MSGRPKFIFTLTTGHAGGTLLNLLLGTSPAIFAAGESLRISNLSKLSVQSESTQALWFPAVKKMRELGWAIDDMTSSQADAASIELWENWVKLIADISASPVVADKTLSLKLISKVCGAGSVNPFFVHLIRDPRAVCYSFLKKGTSCWRQARSWNKSHSAIEKFLKGRDNLIQIRYEDLVSEPDLHLRSILDSAGKFYQLDLLSGAPDNIASRKLDAEVFENHIFAGNRMRHDENRIGKSISVDNEFVAELRSWHWLTTNAFCYPRLLRYGYAISRKRIGKEGEGASDG